MQRRNPTAGRRFALMMIDAALAFVFMGWLLSDVPRETRVSFEMCAALSTVLGLNILGGYESLLRRRWISHACLLASCAGIALLVSVMSKALGIRSVPGTHVCESLAGLFVAMLSVRLLLRLAHRSLLVPDRLWVVADTLGVAQRLAKRARKEATLYRVVHISAQPSRDEMRRILPETDAILSTSAMRPWLQPLCNAHKKRLLVLPTPSDAWLSCAQAQPLEDGFLLSLPILEIGALRRFCKRALDLVGASILLVVASPLVAAIYVLIPRTSSGHAIYRQARRGLHGRRFEIIKFRTMKNDAEEHTGPVFARRQDDRITKLGRILRATRLDELPQLINVLKGEMSLVGPRPERECFARVFDEQFPDYPLRTRVKPGLTGMAQVMGSYSTSAEDKLRLDLWYIANQSLALDLQLLLRTGRVMMHREKAAGVSEIPLSCEPSGRRTLVRPSAPVEALRPAESARSRSER